MGVGYDFICKTCKTSHYLGYGSYGTWLCYDEKETVKTFDERYANTENGKLNKNQNFRSCLVEHETHDWITANWDHWGIERKDGSLYAEIGDWGAPVTMIADYGIYNHVDMTVKKQEVRP